MPLFPNYIRACPYFETRFYQNQVMPDQTKKKKKAWNSILGRLSSTMPLQGFKTSLQGLKTSLQSSLNLVWGDYTYKNKFCRKTPLQGFKTSLQDSLNLLWGDHTKKKKNCMELKFHANFIFIIIIFFKFDQA